LEDRGVDGSIILKWILKKCYGEFIDFAQDRDMWWTLVNAAITLPVLKNAGDFFD
jgi:hypothetical protein